MLKDKAHITRYIKETAADLGFDECGITAATYLSDDARRLEQWLHKGMHGSMHYMENHFDLRVDPTKLVPGAKSVITLLFNYFPNESQAPNIPKISSYAFGKDYHDVIRTKLNAFIQNLKTKVGDFSVRGFVDSAPVLERSWAQKSGLGWIGKNGNLINKNKGSFFFIATLICDLELEYDLAYSQDYCGTCTRCIDQCPTEAILPDKTIDGSKCISYFTIELKDLIIPESMNDRFNGWMFGCDTCQDVCPWNRFSKPNQTPEFKALPELLHYSISDWELLTETQFAIIFKDSPIKRAKFQGIRRNLQFIRNDYAP